MASSEELFMAKLSMDSYNRGYGAGLEDGVLDADINSDGLGEAGSKIGNAIVKDADLPEGSQDAGFYAVAYEWNGQTAISYRGTDNLDILSWDDQYGSGIWNAYAQGAGGLLVGLSEQNALAAEFFQAVTGTSDGDPAQGNAILAGHSLGGGLAAERLAA